MRVFYAEANYGDEEVAAALNVLKEQRHSLMDGKNVKELEAKVAAIFRKKNGVMVNSGSSANLLAVKGLRLAEGTEVITPALTFSTTVSPLVQCNLTPVFVDCDPETLQMEPSLLESINLDNVSAICVPNLIGNVAHWSKIRDFARANNLKVIEDSADTIGYSHEFGDDDWSDASTTSFYASHVVTGAGFGGAVAFKNEEDFNYARSLRGWGRRSSQYGETEDYERRFSCQVDGLDYDDKYVFDDLGFNLIPSEISAAFANIQLDNLEKNIANREANFNYMSDAIGDIPEYKTMVSYDGVRTGWLAFPIILGGKLAGKRKQLQIFLEQNGIQTRTIFTGNITRQPVAQKFEWKVAGNLSNSDYIMQNGILLGCHNQMTKEKMDFVISHLHDFLQKNAR